MTWHITKAKWQHSKYLAEPKLAVCLAFNPNTAAMMDYIKTALNSLNCLPLTSETLYDLWSIIGGIIGTASQLQDVWSI